MKPRARKQGLVLKELPDEILVYDLARHHAHCLNRTAGIVFKHCDGETSVQELAALLDGEAGQPADENLVWLALEQLEKAELLEEQLRPLPESGPRSRREMMKRMGLAAATLLPLVTSIVAPTPAEAAASCVTLCTGMPFGTRCGDCIDDYCDGAGACVNV
jgi:hypothetical protein